jgi:hypothetical protein
MKWGIKNAFGDQIIAKRDNNKFFSNPVLGMRGEGGLFSIHMIRRRGNEK